MNAAARLAKVERFECDYKGSRTGGRFPGHSPDFAHLLTPCPVRVLLTSGMPGTAQIDVFISYTGCDWGWARWLDFVLREAGYTTTVQGYDFAIGKSFVRAMDEALSQSRLVTCLLSPAYLASRWCSEEWEAGLYRDKLFLLRIADCNPDGVLGSRTYLDLVGIPEDDARDQLLTELTKRSGQDPRPNTKPTYPGRLSTSSPRPRLPGNFPPIWNITEERNAYFTGRDEVLERMHRELTEAKSAAITQAVFGLGRVGKTQLALEYAYRYANEYEGVWWLHAEEPVTLAREYGELAPKLGIAQVANQTQMIRDVRDSLSRRERLLLVFDNATDPSAIKPYLPLGAGRQVIVTTRVPAWPNAIPQEVTALSLDALPTLPPRQSDEDATESRGTGSDASSGPTPESTWTRRLRFIAGGVMLVAGFVWVMVLTIVACVFGRNLLVVVGALAAIVAIVLLLAYGELVEDPFKPASWLRLLPKLREVALATPTRCAVGAVAAALSLWVPWELTFHSRVKVSSVSCNDAKGLHYRLVERILGVKLWEVEDEIACSNSEPFDVWLPTLSGDPLRRVTIMCKWSDGATSGKEARALVHNGLRCNRPDPDNRQFSPQVSNDVGTPKAPATQPSTVPKSSERHDAVKAPNRAAKDKSPATTSTALRRSSEPAAIDREDRSGNVALPSTTVRQGPPAPVVPTTPTGTMQVDPSYSHPYELRR